MKKSFLFYLCIIPLVTSCNRSISLGFENPFPDDNYLKEDSKEHYIGFRFLASDERVEKSFTVETDILNTIQETINGNYNRYITNTTASIHTRVYDRAFANQFKQGYTALNSMSDETRSVQSQDYPSESNPVPVEEIDTKRRITETNVTSLNDYTYGRVETKTISKSYDYILDDDSLTESTKKWADITEGNININTRTSTSINGTVTVTDKELATFEKKETTESLDVEPMQIKQNDYIFMPDQSAGDPSGISEDGTPILIKRSTVAYGDDGFYHLGDGRQFSAVTNTITVSQLQLMKEEDGEWDNDWYLVKKVRQYSEVTITSEEVEPNMPISTLAVPVTIQFKEARISFEVKTGESLVRDKNPLPEVTEV